VRIRTIVLMLFKADTSRSAFLLALPPGRVRVAPKTCLVTFFMYRLTARQRLMQRQVLEGKLPCFQSPSGCRW
jgi:hypothetical protein